MMATAIEKFNPVCQKKTVIFHQHHRTDDRSNSFVDYSFLFLLFHQCPLMNLCTYFPGFCNRTQIALMPFNHLSSFHLSLILFSINAPNFVPSPSLSLFLYQHFPFSHLLSYGLPSEFRAALGYFSISFSLEIVKGVSFDLSNSATDRSQYKGLKFL